VHYKEQFIPPAPFKFVILNSNLQTEQNKDFILKVKSQGTLAPENCMIFIDNQSYFMESTGVGEFQFKISKPFSTISFHLEANEVTSPDYVLNVVTVPSIANFEMALNFPSYLKKHPENIKGTGNAIIPEGTQVTWRMNTLATQKVDWTDLTLHFPFLKHENTFSLSRKILQNTEYQILTSNDKVKTTKNLIIKLQLLKTNFLQLQFLKHLIV